MSVQSVISTYHSMAEADQAVRILDKSGFPIKQVSIVAKDMQSEKEVHGYVTAGDVALSSAGSGAWVGGIFGMLIGAAFIWVPGVGPLVVAGSFASMLLGSIEGAVTGAAGAGLLGALAGWGVSKKHIIKYEEYLKGGQYLLIVHGSAEEMTRAQAILQSSGAIEVTQHVEAEETVVAA